MPRFLLLCCLTVFGCSTPSPEAKRPELYKTYPLKYAEGFSIVEFETKWQVKVHQAYPGADTLFYTIYKYSQQDGLSSGANRIICTSTTHLPALAMLDEEASLIGFPGTKYISTKDFIPLVEAGEIKELGQDQQLNIENIATLNPDWVMAFSRGNDMQQLRKLEQMGISVVFNGDYMESSVLGRAEWIKFMAVFFNKLEMADSIFNQIETDYLSLKEKAIMSNHKPTVLKGLLYGDRWFLPGGHNWGATLIEDAGGQYLWESTTDLGWLELSYETVLDKAQNAEYWIGVGSIMSLDQLAEADQRYRQFRPFKEKKVYSYMGRLGPYGGVDYLENGYARPDIVLRDMVEILHPEILSDHQLHFFMPLTYEK